jgi:phage gpG-like protein
VTPQELPAYLEGIRARIAAAEVPVAQEMGRAYKEHLVGFTLHESGSHPPVTRTPAPEGRPPAFMPGGVNGSLAGSVTQGATEGGDGWGQTSVAPHTVYAATQQWGGVHRGNMALWIRYIGYEAVKEAGWLRKVVDIPARPYMNVAVDEMIANGQLSRVAADTFEAVVWGE